MIALKWINYGFRTSTVLRIIGLPRATFYFNISEKDGNKKLSLNKSMGRPLPGYSITEDGQKIDDCQIKQWVLDLVGDEAFSYGYLKITYCLKKKYNLIINKKKVYRLCKELDILKPQQVIKNKYPRRIAKNRVVTGPNQLWQTDIKYGYIAGEDRFFYVLSYIDVYDRSIVGYYTGLYCVAENAVSALKQGILKRNLHEKEHNLVVRSDNGS